MVFFGGGDVRLREYEQPFGERFSFGDTGVSVYVRGVALMQMDVDWPSKARRNRVIYYWITGL